MNWLEEFRLELAQRDISYARVDNETVAQLLKFLEDTYPDCLRGDDPYDAAKFPERK